MKKIAILNIIALMGNIVYILCLVVLFGREWNYAATHETISLMPDYNVIYFMYVFLWPMLIVDTIVLVINFIRLTKHEVCEKEAIAVILFTLVQFFIFAMMIQCLHNYVILRQPVFRDSNTVRAVFLILTYILPFIVVNIVGIIISIAVLSKKKKTSVQSDVKLIEDDVESYKPAADLMKIRKKVVLSTVLLSAGILSNVVMSVTANVVNYYYKNIWDRSTQLALSLKEAWTSYSMLIGALQLVVFVAVCVINRPGSGMPYNDSFVRLTGVGFFATNIALFLNVYGLGFSMTFNLIDTYVVLMLAVVATVIWIISFIFNVDILLQIRRIIRNEQGTVRKTGDGSMS